jgi:hypothetical protein
VVEEGKRPLIYYELLIRFSKTRGRYWGWRKWPLIYYQDNYYLYEAKFPVITPGNLNIPLSGIIPTSLPWDPGQGKPQVDGGEVQNFRLLYGLTVQVEYTK